MKTDEEEKSEINSKQSLLPAISFEIQTQDKLNPSGWFGVPSKKVFRSLNAKSFDRFMMRWKTLFDVNNFVIEFNLGFGIWGEKIDQNLIYFEYLLTSKNLLGCWLEHCRVISCEKLFLCKASFSLKLETSKKTYPFCWRKINMFPIDRHINAFNHQSFQKKTKPRAIKILLFAILTETSVSLLSTK